MFDSGVGDHEGHGVEPAVGFIDTLKEGVKVEYKVIINDFNELYENGYEIIGQEGKIFTIEKK